MKRPERLIATAALAVLATGCADGRFRPFQRDPSGCDPARVERFKGRIVSPGLARHLERLSLADTMRYVRPGTMVSAEVRPDRLEVTLDPQDRIIGFRCR